MADPVLKAAMEEIKAVLKKHDLAGMVAISTANAMEYLYEISPSWSCATPEDGGIRFRAKREDFPAVAAHAKIVSDTAGMFFGFHDLANQFSRHTAGMMHLLGRHFDISHVTTHLPPEA